MPKITKTPLVECTNLCKLYDTKIALNDVSLKIPRGKIIGLLGQNGAGKTTLIKVLNGLIMPTSGEVLVNGQPIGVESKKIISYLPERSYLNRDATLQDMLDYFEDFYADFDCSRALELTDDLKLDPRLKSPALAKACKKSFNLSS